MKWTMGSRLATDDEVKRWQTDGWVLLEGLISTDEIDAAATDLGKTFPSNDEYQADPEGVTEKWKGRPALAEGDFVWPEEGPGFRPEQHLWSQAFPFPGEGSLNRLCVHPSVVDFAERALGDPQVRLYQIHASAKYSGLNQLRATNAYRPESFLAAGGRQAPVVEPRGLPLHD